MRVVVERGKERLVRDLGEADPSQEIPGDVTVQHEVHEPPAGRDVQVAFHWLDAVRRAETVVPPALGNPAQEAAIIICSDLSLVVIMICNDLSLAGRREGRCNCCTTYPWKPCTRGSDLSFGIHSHKTLDSAQPCYL